MEGEQTSAILSNLITTSFPSFGKVLLTELRGSQNYYAVKVGHLILEPHQVSD